MLTQQATFANPIWTGVPERRRKPRLECVCPAIVRGRDACGDKFEEPATTVNLSAGGVYLRMNQRLEYGSKLFVLVRLVTALRGDGLGSSIAMRGVVVRSEPRADGQCGLALKLDRYHFV
ncbi:MAG: PilZ domain-containing protein [Chloroflexi bacterium]|nr:PilZ domain-containing protein [Chloroflexota bacterium]